MQKTISTGTLELFCAKNHSKKHQTLEKCDNFENRPSCKGYLTIIIRARMGYESIAHEAEGRMAIDSEAMRARGIIVLVKSN